MDMNRMTAQGPEIANSSLRTNRRNRDPLLKYGNHDVVHAPQGISLMEDPVVFFRTHHFLCGSCNGSWYKGSKKAAEGCWCRNCHLYLLPYFTKYGRTPYQGPRRMFGLFQCPCCPRFWVSSCSWAETSQQCQACCAKVYPFKQQSLRHRDHIHNSDQGITRDPERRHLVDLCERCVKTGLRCNGGTFLRSPSVVAQHVYGAHAEASSTTRESKRKQSPSSRYRGPRKQETREENDVIVVADMVAATQDASGVPTGPSGGRGGGGDNVESGIGQSRGTRNRAYKAKKVTKFRARITGNVRPLPTIEEMPVVLVTSMTVEDGQTSSRPCGQINSSRNTVSEDPIVTLEREFQDVTLTDRPAVSCWND